MAFAKTMSPLALALLCGSVAFAQSTPAFEAASLKVSKPDSSGGVSMTATQWVWTKASLNQLIKVAFNVKDYSLSAPAWLDQTEFDLVAKIPAGTAPGEPAKMLQTLLVERFKLAYHFESGTTNGYALLVMKGGLKVRPVEVGIQRGSAGPDRLMARSTSLAQLAAMLSIKLDRPVQDQTGIAGVFDFDLKWTPEAGPSQMAPGAAVEPIGPTLFLALQEQLGLKLEAHKAPVQVLSIDHAERTPIEN